MQGLSHLAGGDRLISERSRVVASRKVTDREHERLLVAAERVEGTAEGRLPSDGLRISYGAYGYGLAAAQLDATGIVSLGLVISY